MLKLTLKLVKLRGWFKIYFVELSLRSQKFLSKLDDHIKKRIENKLKLLAKIPVPSDAKFIRRDKGEKVFRIRIGDYRALYKIKEKIILIAKIDKRPRVYGRGL
jgi:mRNA interferase RelE/StbE